LMQEHRAYIFIHLMPQLLPKRSITTWWVTMIRSRAEYLERWSQLHGQARPHGVVRGWLWVAYHLAYPFARMRFSPDLISIFGVLAAVGALNLARADRVFWAAGIVVASLIFDGLDGAVAVLRRRESSWGAVVDAVLDRVAEAIWAGLLVVVGVPVWIAVAGWSLAMIQEYARARYAALDSAGSPIVVSICERPVRALLIASAAVMSADVPLNDVVTPTLVAASWVAMQSVALLQVWWAARGLSADQ
jgi:archaetidylinositol phosphate synthase